MKAKKYLILIQIEIINETFPDCSQAFKNYKCVLAYIQTYQKIRGRSRRIYDSPNIKFLVP